MNKEQAAAERYPALGDAHPNNPQWFIANERAAFLAGVEWRDRNPPWVSVKDGAPEYDKEALWLLDDGNVYVDFLDKDDPYPFLGITHWIYVPSLPTTK